MKSLKLLLLIVFAFPMMANTSCEAPDQATVIHHAKKAPDYVDATVEIKDTFESVDTSGSTLEDVKNYVDAGASAATTITAVAPNPYTGPIAWGLGIISFGLSFFLAKEKRINKNYREGIEAGISAGEDPEVVDVATLKESLDKETKAHFNSTGINKL